MGERTRWSGVPRRLLARLDPRLPVPPSRRTGRADHRRARAERRRRRPQVPADRGSDARARSEPAALAAHPAAAARRVLVGGRQPGRRVLTSADARPRRALARARDAIGARLRDGVRVVPGLDRTDAAARPLAPARREYLRVRSGRSSKVTRRSRTTAARNRAAEVAAQLEASARPGGRRSAVLLARPDPPLPGVASDRAQLFLVPRRTGRRADVEPWPTSAEHALRAVAALRHPRRGVRPVRTSRRGLGFHPPGPAAPSS